MKTAILGASGYGGGELVRLIDAHPVFETSYLGAHSQAGEVLGTVHPHLDQPERELKPLTSELPGIDLAFIALPHGASAEIGVALSAAGIKVVDLGSDFRLDSNDRYRQAYGADHPHPETLVEWVYGLPELFGGAIRGAQRVAAPGCYPTASLLAIVPLVQAGLIGEGVVIDAMSGVSGAGRALRADLLYGAVDEGVRAYAVGRHRHRPEIEMALEAAVEQQLQLTFTPHLVPMQRGILATCTAPAARATSGDEVQAVLRDFAADKPFVAVLDEPPQTRWVVGSNRAMLAGYHDPHTDSVIVMCVIDNLVKGAAGQAIQAANLMMGLDETAGLPSAGWMP